MARLIKRYDNRKLYDTVDKRYISLEEIAELVRAGQQVEITDNATGADLTAETLTKVILEEQSSKRALPPQFLHDLLRSGGKALSTGVARLNRSLDVVLEASLRRMTPVRQVTEEMARLRERMNRLERLIDSMEEGRQHGNDRNSE